jgi:spermidine dehydrogenase
MTADSDKDLGMDRPITRRDFLQGAAISVSGTLIGGLAPELVAAAAEIAEQDLIGYYPPTRLGMRGSHPGSFEAAHTLRDARSLTGAITDTGESFDLIVVGAGISGLAAAHFFRSAAPRGRVLVLDNHDDFGGHAKRNEFHVGGRIHLLNGGTLSIESPRPYGKVAASLMRTLGIGRQSARRRVLRTRRFTNRSVCTPPCSSIARRSASTDSSCAKAKAAKTRPPISPRRRSPGRYAGTSSGSSTAMRTTCLV